MSTMAENLRSEVLSHKLKGVTLENDLRKLGKVNAAGASEAVVFYCARILEAVIKEAHRQFFGMNTTTPAGRRQPVLSDMEQQLHDYNLLRQSSYYWAKGLRLLGNGARHELRRISRKEADCAMTFLEFVLVWYFCSFPQGPRLQSIFRSQNPAASDDLLLNLAWSLDSSRLNPDRLKVIFGKREQEYLRLFSENFTVPLLLIEIFIALGDHASAERLVSALKSSADRQKGALKNRFSQLKGLLLSRKGELHEALQVLEAEYSRQQNDRYARPDDETVGILAGVYKRLWQETQKDSWLNKSHEIYYSGWRNSRNSNTYLGINTASTALMLGNNSLSIQTAREVKGILERRRKMIRQNTEGSYDLNYWDMVTLAEAKFLIRDSAGALELYSSAFDKFKTQTDSIVSSRKQLGMLVNAMKVDSVPHDKILNLLSM